MNSVKKISICYDSVSEQYARNLADELSKKPFDRMILKNFAHENRRKGPVLDLGCGPGQTTRFLKDHGLKNISGIDISQNMINKARYLNKDIRFETGDMLDLKYKRRSVNSVVAFYAIVNFNYKQINIAFREISRILKKNGQFLFSFHIGEERVHIENFLDQKVDIDFYFLNTDKVLKLLKKNSFKIINAVERFPYPDIEYQSKRAYILGEKI